MPKPYTFPTLFNEALQISISKLKEWDYLEPGQIKTGIITWSSRGNKTGSISIRVNTQSEQPYIELDYKFKNEPRNYKVRLVFVLSNLGKGVIWYFHCPQTNKRCRKLYSIGGYFLHREAFNGCMYESQTKSKSHRQRDKIFDVVFKPNDLYNKLNEKHFKKSYAGKPTKKYLRIMEEIQKVESVSYSEIEREIRNWLY